MSPGTEYISGFIDSDHLIELPETIPKQPRISDSDLMDLGCELDGGPENSYTAFGALQNSYGLWDKNKNQKVQQQPRRCDVTGGRRMNESGALG
jgi:hypothetical protein